MPPQLKHATSQAPLEQWLTTTIAIFGASQLIFFVPILVLLPFRPDLPPALQALLRWGPGGAEQYEEMIAIIYVVWGYFMLRAARSPFEHALFLDFTASANVAHIGLMTLMAVLNKGDRIHLVGDVLAAWLVLAPFVYVWAAVRSERGKSRGSG